MTETQVSEDYRERMAACAAAINLDPPSVVLPEDRFVELNDITFHYLDWGNEHLPHVVLLHGGSLTAHTWDMASLLLRDRYHLVALDQRGHGDSGWTTEERLEQDNSGLMDEDTYEFIEHLGYDHIALVGMSMGGMNAVRYAARHPQRLDTLTIVDVGPSLMSQGLVEMEQFRRETETMERFEDFLERAINFNPQRKPDHLAYSLTHSLKQTEDGWTWKQDHRSRPTLELSEEERRVAFEARDEAMWTDLRAIHTPTLLMRGEISHILAPETADEMVEEMPHTRLVTIAGAGHSVQGDNPRDFAKELDSFLSQTPSPAAS